MAPFRPQPLVITQMCALTGGDGRHACRWRFAPDGKQYGRWYGNCDSELCVVFYATRPSCPIRNAR